MPEELAELYKNTDEVAVNYTLRAVVTGRLLVQLLTGAGDMKPPVQISSLTDVPRLSASLLKVDVSATWLVLDTHAGDSDEWTRVWTYILEVLGKGGPPHVSCNAQRGEHAPYTHL